MTNKKKKKKQIQEQLKNNRGGESHPTTESNKMKNKLKNTIELIELMNKTLVDVIQFLDSKGHSNTEVRSSVDKLLNHQQGLKKDVEQEIKKVVGVN